MIIFEILYLGNVNQIEIFAKSLHLSIYEAYLSLVNFTSNEHLVCYLIISNPFIQFKYFLFCFQESVCVMEEDPYVSSGDDKPEVRQSTIARLLLSNRMTRPDVSADVPSTAEESGLSEVPTITLDGDSSQDQHYVVNCEAGRSDFESGRSEYDLNRGDLSPLDEYSEDRSSPENLVTPTGFSIAARLYKCRFCNFSTMKYTQLQLHMPKHGGE